MDSLINGFLADPMYYIGLCFAFVAAIAFLALLRGFLTGAPNLFTIATHAGHLKRYRFRTVWGAVGLFGLLLAWETLRWILAFFDVGTSPDAGALSALWVGYLIVGAILWISFSVKSAVTNKEH
jgi:hypothetical protein